MKSAVTVSLVPQARGGPFVFWDDLAAGCEKAAALGFDAVEIFAPSASAIDRKALQRLLGHHRLKVAAVGTGAGWVIHKWQLCHADDGIRSAITAMIPYTSCNSADHTPFPGANRGPANDVTARQLHSAGPGEATRQSHARRRPPGPHPSSEHAPR